MSLVNKHKEKWREYLEYPETNPLMYNHLEQYGKVILENTLCFFLQDEVGEILPGSGMIIPKAYRPTVFDLTQEDFIATHDLLKKSQDVLGRNLKT
jgi:diadenosine tetraphosphate (Ap4A) HIT family hydrolase